MTGGQPAEKPAQQRVLTSEDRYWAERAARLDQTSLTELRATAERWRGGLTALTALVATVLAVGTPFIGETVASGTVRIVIGVGMGLAVVALGTATWLAMVAAFGIPEEIDNSGEALATWSATAAKSAQRNLTGARRLTLAGFGFLLGTAGVGLFGASDDPEASRVTLKDKTEYCGELSFRDEGATVVVTGPDGTVHSRPLSDVASIDLEAGCG